MAFLPIAYCPLPFLSLAGAFCAVGMACFFSIVSKSAADAVFLRLDFIQIHFSYDGQ